MRRLEGRTAIVTGGGSGIGKATCLRLAEEGAAIIVAELDESSGRSAAEDIVQSGGRAQFIATDVANEQSVQQMVFESINTFGNIHILINNAAVFVLEGIDATVEQWQQSLGVNVIGTALVSKHVVRELRKTGGGAIVNLGSISSFIAQPNFVTYNATKAAIVSMTRCMALDLADDNIRVNAVCPGTVWTPVVERLAAEDGLDREAADSHPDYGAAHMIKRVADPREIANAILFLASDEASFITAECLMVDGGFVAK